MATEFRERIGKDLKVVRKLLGLTQKEVADFLDLEQSAFSRIEDGKQKLTDEDFIKLRALLRKQPNLFWDEI